MGTTQLKQILRSLCFSGEWKYAVFWRLKHRDRMVLTWEDAYYENHVHHDPLENKCSEETLNTFPGVHHPHVPLGLAVAKMSYHVYSLGEGIVGQVAATGKHQWIFADECVTNSSSSFEYGDGWKTQLSAGIRTVIGVAVFPHGVVQLGSFNKVTEDLMLVNHVREVFYAFQDSSPGDIYSPDNINKFLHLREISIRSSGLGGFHDCLHNFENADNKGRPKWPPMRPSIIKASSNPSSFVSPLGLIQKKTVEVGNNQGAHESSIAGGDNISNLLSSKSKICNMERHVHGQLKLHNDREWLAKANGWKDVEVRSKHCTPLIQGVHVEDTSSYDTAYSANNNNHFAYLYSSSDLLHTDTSNASFNFSAGSELLEVLGPAFSKQTHYDWEVENTEAGTTLNLPEKMNLTTDFESEQLLEAVVANICSDVKSEKSSCKSVQSLVTSEIMKGPVNHNKHSIISVLHSINQPSLVEEDAYHYLSSSETGVVISQRGFSSTCPINTNKKRSIPGENCRPRPRDRQLIQDRIKELRELVPSGSKCSIDSLLERTIKQMLFLQSIAKHSDKLKNCSETKLCKKETDILGTSNSDEDSSWAVEVGSHLKVCTVIVKNLNMNGEMLVEMLCEECRHFLEIAEAIQSLGLTILKGVTESHGEKTWICFVVEAQNKSMHRMDILWPLVQILQTQTTTDKYNLSTASHPPF